MRGQSTAVRVRRLRQLSGRGGAVGRASTVLEDDYGYRTDKHAIRYGQGIPPDVARSAGGSLRRTACGARRWPVAESRRIGYQRIHRVHRINMRPFGLKATFGALLSRKGVRIRQRARYNVGPWALQCVTRGRSMMLARPVGRSRCAEPAWSRRCRGLDRGREAWHRDSDDILLRTGIDHA